MPQITLNMSAADRLAGLGQLALVLVGLYLLGAFLIGRAFYAMTWTGQSVLRQLRQELFRHIQRLSVGYYARNEAGDVMSRVTNDMDTIEQAFSFALMQVISGLLLMIWIVLRMLQTQCRLRAHQSGDHAGDDAGDAVFFEPGAQGLP